MPKIIEDRWEWLLGLFTIDEKGCWIARVKNNYFWFGGEKRYGYSITYELLTGRRIRKGDNIHLHHNCLNHRCMNPYHIEELTPGEHHKIHSIGTGEHRKAKIQEKIAMFMSSDSSFDKIAKNRGERYGN